MLSLYGTINSIKKLAFKEGDKVFLKQDADCDNGWRGDKHYLIAGNSAKIIKVDCTCRENEEGKRNFQFEYLIEPDGQSHISTRGNKVLCVLTHSHYFSFVEYKLTKTFFECMLPSQTWQEEDNGIKYEMTSFINTNTGGELVTRFRFPGTTEWFESIEKENIKKCNCCGQSIK